MSGLPNFFNEATPRDLANIENAVRSLSGSFIGLVQSATRAAGALGVIGPSGAAVSAGVGLAAAGIDTLQKSFREMTTAVSGELSSLSASVKEFVAASNPEVMRRFADVTKDLAAAFGQIFAPAMRDAILLIDKFNVFITNLPRPVKAFLELVGKLAVQFTAVAAVLTPVIGVLTAFGTVVGSLTAITVVTAVLGQLLAVIGSIAAVIAAPLAAMTALSVALAGLVYWFSQTEAGSALIDAVAETLGEAFDLIAGAAEFMWSVVSPVFTGMLSLIGTVVRTIMAIVRPLFESIKMLALSVGDAFRSLFSALYELFQPLISIVTTLMQLLGGLAGVILMGLVEALKLLVDGLTKVILMAQVMAETLKKNPAGLLDMANMAKEVDKRFADLQKRAKEWETKSKSFAAGSANFVNVEDIGRKAEQAAASSGGGANSAEEDRKKAEAEADKKRSTIAEYLRQIAAGVGSFESPLTRKTRELIFGL